MTRYCVSGEAAKRSLRTSRSATTGTSSLLVARVEAGLEGRHAPGHRNGQEHDDREGAPGALGLPAHPARERGFIHLRGALESLTLGRDEADERGKRGDREEVDEEQTDGDRRAEAAQERLAGEAEREEPDHVSGDGDEECRRGEDRPASECLGSGLGWDVARRAISESMLTGVFDQFLAIPGDHVDAVINADAEQQDGDGVHRGVEGDAGEAGDPVGHHDGC